MSKLLGMIALSMLLLCGAAHAADEAPKKGPVQEREAQAAPATAQAQERPMDACGGAASYVGLRILAKDEILAPGSRKVDVSKLPAGSRVFDARQPHPQANDADANNSKRLNLIIDHRNVIAEAFCG